MIPDPSTVREFTTRWQTTHERGEAVSLDDFCNGDAALIAAVTEELARLAGPAPGSGTITYYPETESIGSTIQPSEPNAPTYRLIRVLGSGTFGTVWLAIDTKLEREVAIKTIRVPANHPDAKPQLDTLRHEAKQLAKIDHPHVVRVHAWWQQPDVDYLVMQYVAGGTLWDRLKLLGRLPWDDAARAIADVAEGLRSIHSAGLVHRDVKPANILWQADAERAILGDLGVAERFGITARVAGSIPYMAPETFAGVVSAAGDVFALAATYFHLVTGEVPFPGKPSGNLPASDPRLAAVPAGIETVIRPALSGIVNRRPSIVEFATQLRAELNRAIGDNLATPRAGLKLEAFRVTPHGAIPIAASRPSDAITRDLKRVPSAPDRATMRTGEILRVQVQVQKSGYLSVWNIGPTGNLVRLFPESGPGWVAAGIVPVFDTELTPPAGRERVIAILTQDPETIRPADLSSVAETTPIVTTRDLKRIQSTLDRLPVEKWCSAVFELDHIGG